MTDEPALAWVPGACTLPTVERPARRAEFDEVADLVDIGRHRHGRRPEAGLQARAAGKLAEIEAKIADLDRETDR